MRIFFVLSGIALLVLLAVHRQFIIQPLDFGLEQFQITIIKGQQERIVKVKPYAILDEVLNDTDLQDVDLGKVNLNQILSDGQVVVLPIRSATACISINTATLLELQELPGIGASSAQQIIDFRQAHGSFTMLEDLMLVKGIKEKTYAKLVDYVCL